MENKKNQLNIGLAIIVAAVIIAGAIFLKGGKAPVAPAPVKGGSPAATVGTIKPVSASDFIQGNPNSKVVLVEYADYQCPFCGRFYSDTVQSIEKDYVTTGKIAYVYRDFAFLGAESQKSAEAASCANDQGKYWEYHNYLFTHQSGENQGNFADNKLEAFAGTLGLDTNQFNTCLESGKYTQAVKNSTAEGTSIGVNGTPHSFILVDGKVVSDVNGAYPLADVTAKLDAALK